MIVGALFLLLVLGVPVGVAFALVVMSKAEAWNIDILSLGSIPYDTISAFPLLAIPLFLLGGELMNRGGLIQQLTTVCDVLLRWVRAPLGYVMVIASALMGAITGSSVATVAAIGGTVGKEMTARGYPAGYTAALNASAGLLGVLVPPSIPLILYGSIVGVSITQLFTASIAPGVVMMLAFCAAHRLMVGRVLPGGREQRSPAAMQPTPASGSAAALLVRSLPALVLPVLVLRKKAETA